MAKPIVKSIVKKKSIKKPLRPIPHQDDTRKPFMRPRLLRNPKLTIVQLLKAYGAGSGGKGAQKLAAAKDIAVRRLFTMQLSKNTKAIPPDTLTYRVQTYSKHNKHVHNVSLFCVGSTHPADINPESKIIVDCSCASHVFQAEYHLAKRGNAFMFRCNGEAPMVWTKLTICKHTYQALKYVLKAAKNNVLPKTTRLKKRFTFTSGT